MTGQPPLPDQTRSRRHPAAGTPLRHQLYLLSAAAILPLAILAALGLRTLETGQLNQAEAVGLELARSVANAVDAELRITTSVLATLATSPTLDRRDLEGFRERADRVLRLHPEWSAIVLSAPDGTPLLDTRAGRDEGMAPPLDRPSLIRAVETMRPVIGRLSRASDDGFHVPVSVPVEGARGASFIVTALVSPDAIRRVLDRQRLPPDWVISIIDAAGLRVARSRAHEENLGGRLSETAQQVVDEGGPEGFGISYTLEGERIYTPYSRLPDGWIAVLGFPTTPTDSAASNALRRYGGGILLSIALAIAGALWVAGTITRPMADLRRAAEAVGRRHSATAPDTSIQELREVAAALNTAADDLARADSEREALLRNEREAREAAESADRAKDEFMAVLSHELRTPLNAVYGWARMLQGGQLGDDATAEQAKDAIVRNASIQIQLIDDLLDLSRIATGKLRLNVVTVNLDEVLQGALDVVRPAAAARSIRLDASLDPDAGTVRGDPARLQQIVWNLLMNAVKFTPRGGEVRLSLKRAASNVTIVVTDTGQGIAPEMLPHVFERFRQSDTSSTRHHGGLGLGLALVKHLAELHGGSVRAESAGRDQGATFTVTLPVALADWPSEHPVPQAVAPDSQLSGLVRLDGLRAVVVDDDAESLALAETILMRAGATVRPCRSAAEAFEALQAGPPDVLISDIEMPGEDGHSLIRRVRALPASEGGSTPAIALTAYGRTGDRQRSLEAGFDTHVPKPVDPGELTAIVASLAGLAGR